MVIRCWEIICIIGVVLGGAENAGEDEPANINGKDGVRNESALLRYSNLGIGHFGFCR